MLQNDLVTFATRVTLCMSLGSSVTQAAVYRLTLKDVTFADGGTATGFFETPGIVEGGSPSNWDITTTGGDESKFPTFEYTPSNSWDGNVDYVSFSVELGAPRTGTDYTHVLDLFFPATSNGLPPASGVLPLERFSNSHNFPSAEHSVVGGTFFQRDVIGGCAVSGPFNGACPPLVPEPSMLAFLGIGLVFAIAGSLTRAIWVRRFV
jgi:hypothetical protein